MSQKTVEISVVMPALNESRYIERSLIALKNQSFKNFETIVVDGASSDNTRGIARKYARVVVQQRRGMSLARNTGAKLAKGKILFFLDADTQISRDLLSIYHRAFQNENVVMATGPLTPLEDASALMRFAYKLDSVYIRKLTFALGNPEISACNFAVRRSAFDEVHGFNNAYATWEGYDLSRRLSGHGKALFIGNAVVKTSMRRIAKRGILNFVAFRIADAVKVHTIGKPLGGYGAVR